MMQVMKYRVMFTEGMNNMSETSYRTYRCFASFMIDLEYRHGVRYLEHLRKAQIETMNHAMKVSGLRLCMTSHIAIWFRM